MTILEIIGVIALIYAVLGNVYFAYNAIVEWRDFHLVTIICPWYAVMIITVFMWVLCTVGWLPMIIMDATNRRN